MYTWNSAVSSAEISYVLYTSESHRAHLKNSAMSLAWISCVHLRLQQNTCILENSARQNSSIVHLKSLQCPCPCTLQKLTIHTWKICSVFSGSVLGTPQTLLWYSTLEDSAIGLSRNIQYTSDSAVGTWELYSVLIRSAKLQLQLCILEKSALSLEGVSWLHLRLQYCMCISTLENSAVLFPGRNVQYTLESSRG